MQNDTLQTRTIVYHKRGVVNTTTRLDKLQRALKLTNPRRIVIKRWKRNIQFLGRYTTTIRQENSTNNYTAITPNQQVRYSSPSSYHRTPIKENLNDLNILRTTHIREVIKEVPVIKKQIIEVEVEKEVFRERSKEDLFRITLKSFINHRERNAILTTIGKCFRKWKRYLHDMAIKTLQIELTRKPKEIVRQVPTIERVEVIKEVPVIKREIHEVQKEVPVVKKQIIEVEKEVIREVKVVQEVIREVIKEVPVIQKEVVYIEKKGEAANSKLMKIYAMKILFKCFLRSYFSFFKSVVSRFPKRGDRIKLLKKVFKGLSRTSETFRKIAIFNKWKEICRKSRMLYLRGKIFSGLDRLFVRRNLRRKQKCFNVWKNVLKKKMIDLKRMSYALGIFSNGCKRKHFKLVAFIWLSWYAKISKSRGLSALCSKSAIFTRKRLKIIFSKWNKTVRWLIEREGKYSRVLRSLRRFFLEKYIWAPLQAKFYRWKAFRLEKKAKPVSGMSISLIIRRTFMKKLFTSFMRWRNRIGGMLADDYSLKLKKKVLENLFRKSEKLKLMRYFLAWHNTGVVTCYRSSYLNLALNIIKKQLLNNLWAKVIWKIKVSTRGKVMNYVLYKMVAKWQDTVRYYYEFWNKRTIDYRQEMYAIFKEKEKLLKRVLRGIMKTSEIFAKMGHFNKWREVCRNERLSGFRGKFFSKLDKIFVNRTKNNRNKCFFRWKQICDKKFDLLKGLQGLEILNHHCKAKLFSLVVKCWYENYDSIMKGKGISAICLQSSTFQKRKMRFIIQRWYKVSLFLRENENNIRKSLKLVQKIFLEKYVWSAIKTAFSRWRRLKEDSSQQIQNANLKLLSSLYSRGKKAMTRRLLSKFMKRWNMKRIISIAEMNLFERHFYRYIAFKQMRTFFFDMNNYAKFRFLRSLFSKNSKFHKRALRQGIQQWNKVVTYLRFQDESSNLRSCLFIKTIKSKSESYFKAYLRRSFSQWRNYITYMEKLTYNLEKGLKLINAHYLRKALNVTVHNYKLTVKKCAKIKSIAATVRKTLMRKLMLGFVHWRSKVIQLKAEEYQLLLKQKIFNKLFSKSIKMQKLKAFLLWKGQCKKIQPTYYILGAKLMKIHYYKQIWETFVFKMKFAGRGKKVSLLMLKYASKWQDQLKLKFLYWNGVCNKLKLTKQEAKEKLRKFLRISFLRSFRPVLQESTRILRIAYIVKLTMYHKEIARNGFIQEILHKWRINHIRNKIAKQLFEAMCTKFQQTYFTELIESEENTLLKEYEEEIGNINRNQSHIIENLTKKVFKDTKKKYLVEGYELEDSNNQSVYTKKNGFKSLDYGSSDNYRANNYQKDYRPTSSISSVSTSRQAVKTLDIDEDYRARILQGGKSTYARESDYKISAEGNNRAYSNVHYKKDNYDSLNSDLRVKANASEELGSRTYSVRSEVDRNERGTRSKFYSGVSEADRVSISNTDYTSNANTYRAEIKDGYIQYVDSDGKLVKKAYP
jgi:hypothetical protein